MKRRTAYIVLAIIFAIVLSSRLYFALQTADFSYDAYDELRQIEHIKETGKPIYQDDLSFSGRTNVFAPFFYYLIAFFSFFMPVVLAAKIIPNILAACTVFIVYLVTHELTKKHLASLISALFSGFLLVFFTRTLNTISPYTLVIPLIFLITYCILKIKKPAYLYLTLVLMLILVLSHITAFLLIFALVFFFLIARLENFELLKERIELLLFITFLTFWFNFIIYKNAFLVHGAKVIWQNTPILILSSYFTEITFLQVIYAIGVIPLILGVYAIYYNFFEQKQKPTYLFMGFAIAVFLLLWFKLIPLDVGLIFLGVVLTILAGVGLEIMIGYFNKTRFSKVAPYIISILLVLFIITSVFPLINAATMEMRDKPRYAEKQALEWLGNHTENDSIILGTMKEGHVINYFAGRKNVIDSNFLMVPLADQRYADVNRIFTTPYKPDSVRLLNQYGITHIYFSPTARQTYNISKVYYIHDEECFLLLYNETVQIYLSRCRID
ncbi:MAG: glycosyltransferase family 39 protein [archaeon]